MALLDTSQAMYCAGVTSQYLIQQGYTRPGPAYSYRDYEPEALARLNSLNPRLHSSPEQPHYDLHARLFVKEERLAGLGGLGGVTEVTGSYNTAFKPYCGAASPADQENVPHHANQQKGFGSKADLQLHTQVHMREPKPYKCSHCSKSFANSSYLSQHMRIHLGIKPYRCEICQRKFTQLSHLQQHIRTHTGDKPYKCRHTGCTKAFSQLSNLQSHSRCHQTDKPYKCNSCYKCFHDEQALLEHIPKHKESKHLKTHICSYCGKSYTQETYLAKHMQKHADRSDKRPPIVASGTTNPPPGMGSLGNLGSPEAGHYWPKMDGYGYGHQLMDQRLGADPRDYDPRGLHPGNHQSLMAEAELRGHQAQAGGWGEHPAPPSATAGVSPNSAASIKSSSAFSPLQSSMLQSSSGFPGMPTPRSYPAFYDPISFPQPPAKVNFAEPSSNSGSAGPQLLSLTKIKNYAHNPHNEGIFKSLTSLSQDKSLNHLGQLGAAQ